MADEGRTPIADGIERLLAIEEIKRLKARYFRTMDTKDWNAFRALFTADVTIDTSDAFTGRDHLGNPIEAGLPAHPPRPELVMRGIDAFMAAQRRYLTGVSTVHHGHTPEIELLSAREATGVWAMEDKLRGPSPSGSGLRTTHGYGHYHERYEKVDGHWLIAALKLTRIRVDIVDGAPGRISDDAGG